MLYNEIIQQLNDANTGQQYSFPNFEIFYPVDARLSAYRSEHDWAIVIETFYFANARCPHDNPATMLWCYGSSLPRNPGPCYPELHVTGDGPSGPLFDLNCHDIVSETATDMTIRGRIVPITTEIPEYAAAGIELSLLSKKSDLWLRLEAALAPSGVNLGQPPRIFGYELFRLLAPKYRRLFFATETEIVQHLGMPMPLLMRFDEWKHPTSDEELYECETFRMIADAISSNDPSVYRPTAPPNTHWSNWPDASVV